MTEHQATKFIVSVDTEEDNWGDYSAQSASLRNIREMPEFHARCEGLGIRPTYLLTYPVLKEPELKAFFAEQARLGACEVGAHCHPWNTPPFSETPSQKNSLLCNLPEDLQRKKIQALTAVFTEQLSLQPTSFRAGRWAIGEIALDELHRLAYLVDSSVVPLQSWGLRSVPVSGRISPRPYWRSAREIFSGAATPESSVVEIPVSVGFVQGRPQYAERLFRAASAAPFRQLRAVGILERLNLVMRVGLLPEIHSLSQMIQLTERLIERSVPYLNFTFHSCTLTPGLTPFTRSAAEALAFKKKILSFLEYVHLKKLQPVTLSEAAREIAGVGPMRHNEPNRSLLTQTERRKAS